MENITQEFDGVFRFTNATDEDATFMWNSIEYKFPAGKMTPMLIQGETPENVQSIRKKWAYKLALREFHKGNVYNTMKEQGRGHPATYDEKLLEPWIEQCLAPLPIGRAEVKAMPKEDESQYKVSKAIDADSPASKNFEGTKVEALGVAFPDSA